MNEERLVLEMTTPKDDGTPVYLTGNFNDWRVGDAPFRMERVSDGHFRYVFSQVAELPEGIEYKYIREDWTGEELDQYGNPIPNRRFLRKRGTVSDFVPRWKKDGLLFDPTMLPEIRVISEPFKIPQLIKTRRIAALLPHDYSQSDRRYPVLYLQDGQNLFDDYAPFGNWGVDKKLAMMAERGLDDIIIVAIDHAQEERIREFTPSTPTRLGVGDGKKYARFLAEMLKPYVDRTFRTLPDRRHTGIGGSSMGGLISIYAGLMYPQVYSKLLIFSPSLWVAPNIHHQIADGPIDAETRIYIYGGGEEGSNMIPNIQSFKHALEQNSQVGRTTFKTSIDPKGKHNEQRWGEEFPHAVEWLFFAE